MQRHSTAVLPLTREWIEIYSKWIGFYKEHVLPLTREWIEIPEGAEIVIDTQSSPSYEGVD